MEYDRFEYECKKNCVCRILKKIDDAQRMVQQECLTDCDNLIEAFDRTRSNKDTIPIILICKARCEPFETVGDGFCTIFFRVSKVHRDCCATLELLEPVKCYECCKKFPELRRSGECLTIDLKSFSGVQCLKPIDGNRPRPPKKHHHCSCQRY